MLSWECTSSVVTNFGPEGHMIQDSEIRWHVSEVQTFVSAQEASFIGEFILTYRFSYSVPY